MLPDEGLSLDRLLEAPRPFGSAPVVVKDFVQSQKHAWLDVLHPLRRWPGVMGIRLNYRWTCVDHTPTRSPVPNAPFEDVRLG
jgi:hypothetical protein